MFASHLYVFFGNISVYFFGPFFDWVIYFSGIELLRVRTGPECPQGNLRELTSDSKPVSF